MREGGAVEEKSTQIGNACSRAMIPTLRRKSPARIA
jgi:hypothetical protein